ncbi:hypothetical protein PISMIDRAFT_684013, partial [Pisolithus microcarpus 441]
MIDTTGTRSTAALVYNLVILAVARVYYFALWISQLCEHRFSSEMVDYFVFQYPHQRIRGYRV